MSERSVIYETCVQLRVDNVEACTQREMVFLLHTEEPHTARQAVSEAKKWARRNLPSEESLTHFKIPADCLSNPIVTLAGVSVVESDRTTP